MLKTDENGKYFRAKKKSSSEEDILKSAKHIFDNFKDYSDGCRVLLLLQRNKEGGQTHNTKLKKIVTRSSQDFLKGLIELVKEKNESELPLRIYSSLNKRDFEKAIRQFKSEQLDADYFHQEQKENFYIDARNRFVGALMQPQQRGSNLFMFDIDEEEGRDVMGETLQVIPNEHILMQYKTKNGWHIITTPFNHTTINLPKNCEFKKDGLLLLDW